jgi:hypothetical protein
VITGTVSGGDEGNRNLDNVGKNLKANLGKIILKRSKLLATYVKTQFMVGGTTPTKLARRTGDLISSTDWLPITATADTIEGGMKFGTRYAITHVGPKGSEKIIKAKPGGALAIPLKAALTGAGVPKGKPRDKSLWGETFIRTVISEKTGEKQAIIFGKAKWVRGQKMGAVKGKIVPLFLLVKQVKVPRRIFPLTILKHVEPQIVEDLRKMNLMVTESGVD